MTDKPTNKPLRRWQVPADWIDQTGEAAAAGKVFALIGAPPCCRETKPVELERERDE